jgi:hypothetical protein
MAASPRNIVVDRGNLAVIAAMSLLWIAPTIRFWGGNFSKTPGRMAWQLVEFGHGHAAARHP